MIKTLPSFTLILIILLQSPISESRECHVITFRSPGVYPKGIAWDPASQHFIIAAIKPGTFHSISDAGVTETLTLTPSPIKLPPNPDILGLSVDHRHNRLLAAVNTAESPYLAAFSLHRTSLSLLFLSPLPTNLPTSAVANDVAIDPHGNAYVTNSGQNFIWKVTVNGTASILSNSSIFARPPLPRNSPYSNSGLNGIVYVNGKEYVLVVQSSTGKLFKVDTNDGTARSVILPLQLNLADSISIRKDGTVTIVSVSDTWMLKSDDSWGEGRLIDKITLEKQGFATGVSVGGGGRVYVLYGVVDEGKNGISESQEIEWFRIEEVRLKGEDDGETLWPFVMFGLGLVYFLYWRFSMAQLVKNMDKKRS